MRLTPEALYGEKLDTTIPELAAAKKLFFDGKKEEAAKVFRGYVRSVLRPDIWLSRNYPILEGTAGYDEMTFADMVVDGYTYSVGYLHRYKDGIIDWNENPTFNNYCEFSYHICYHGVIQALAKAYRKTGDEKYAKRFQYVVSSWIDQAECPESGGNSSSHPLWRPLEAGVRMKTSWPEAIHTFIGSDAIPDTFWVKLFCSVWEHSHRIKTFRLHYNWETTMMAGLVTMGILYPFFTESRDWIEYSLGVLSEQLDEEIYPDGMQAELTTGYQGGVIFNYLEIAKTLTMYGHEVPSCFDDKVKLMYRMYIKLCRPDLCTPALNDGTCANVRQKLTEALGQEPTNQVYRYFSTARKEGKCPDHTSCVLPYSGFVVMRTGWDEDAFWALFDVGPEGTQHVHEDKLNFQIYAYRTDMLSEIGFYAYDTSDMRRYSVSTVSHNTGLVDGCGQNRMKNHNWGLVDTHKKCDFIYRDENGVEFAEASYDDGYGDGLIKVTHTRSVWFFKNGIGGSAPLYVLGDRFVSHDAAEHLLEITFQLPGVPVTAKERKLCAEYDNGTSLTFVSDGCPSVAIGQYAPEYRGWQPIHSPKEHEHLPAPAVFYRKRGKEASFLTVLYPSPGRSSPDISVSVDNGHRTVTVNGETVEL